MPPFLINDFSGGLNRKYRQNRIADNELSRLRNARFTRVGALGKRLGTTRNTVAVGGTDSGSIWGLFAYRLSGMSAEQLLIGDSAGAIIRTTSLGTYTNLVTGLATTYEPNFAAIGDKVYITNGSSAVRSVNDANTVATVTGAPASRYLAVHQGYLFYFNDAGAANYSRLQWSARNNGDSYTSTNFEDISPSDGAWGTGLISYGDELVLFKGPFSDNMSYGTGAMYRVLGDTFDASNPTYTVEKIPMPANVAMVHARSAAILDGLLIFQTNDGFYAYGGGGRPPVRISEIIRDEITDWEALAVYAPAVRAAATVFEGRYICSLYNSTMEATSDNNVIYVYDQGKWWVDLLEDGNDAFTVGASTGTAFVTFGNLLYSGSGGSNVLRRWYTPAAFPDTQDNGAAGNVNFSALTKEFDFGDDVNFSDAYVHLRRQSSGTLALETNVNQQGVATTLIDMTAPDAGSTESSSSNILRKRVSIGRRGRTLQFRFYDRGSNDVEIYAVEVHYAKTGLTRNPG